MASATQERIRRILQQPELQYLVRFRLISLTWDTNFANHPSYVQPTKGAETDITSYVQDWRVEKRIRQLCATLSLTLRADMDDATLRSFQISDMIQVWVDIAGGGESESLQLGTFLIDKVEPNEDPAAPGTWLVECRDVMKLLQRRRYFGNLEPDKIEEPGGGAWVELVRVDPQGVDYYDFYDGTDPVDHTVNWATLPKPLFRVKEDPTKFVVPDDENMRVLFGDGIVRIGKRWFHDMVGTNNHLEVQYYRWAMWEDLWTDPTLRMNTPRDIILDMAYWAGFRGSDDGGDANKICYISPNIEDATHPEPADLAFDGGGTDRTADAAGQGSGIQLREGDYLYVGLRTRRFPALHWYLSSPSEHAATTTAAKVYYWDGAAWVEITPDFDGTQDLHQSGVWSWMDQDLSAWARGRYTATVPEAYWLRVEIVSGTGADLTASHILPGHPIQCGPIRISSADDQTPAEVLEQHVRPITPPNYRWRATADGALEARHDILQVGLPDFTIADETRLTVTPTVPHDDDIKTLIQYRGQARSRFNAALAANGGAFLNLDDPDEENQTYAWLGDGDASTVRDLGSVLASGVTLPKQLFVIDLTGSRQRCVVNEFEPKQQLAYNGITITPGTAGVTWSDDDYGNAVTDGSDSTSEDIYYYGHYPWQQGDYVSFSTPRKVNRIDVRVSDLVYNFVVEIKSSANQLLWTAVATGTNYTSTPQTISFTNLNLTVQKLRIRNSSPATSYPQSGGRLYQLDLYELSESEPAGTFTASGGSGDPADLGDDDYTTGMTFTKVQEGFEISYASGQSIDNIYMHCLMHGEGLIEWQAYGGTAWEPLIYVGPGPLGLRRYGELGLTNVGKIRFRVTKIYPRLELSAIDVYTTTAQVQDSQVSARFRIEYTTVDDPTWRILCDETDGVAFGRPKWSVDKSAFGEELYADRLRFTLLSWGKTATGITTAPLAEIKVWMGDTLWGKAVLGQTAPYDSAEYQALQARLGWKSWLSPVDLTAITQEMVDYRALTVLHEFLRLSAKVHVTDLRPDVDLGQTVYLPTHVQNMYGLDYNYYLVNDIAMHGGSGESIRVEIILLP